MKIETIEKTINKFHTTQSNDSYTACIMQLRFYFDQNGELWVWGDEKEDGMFEPYCLKADNEQKWFPVFTNQDEITNYVNDGVAGMLDFHAILELLNEDVVGIMVNPWGNACPIMREEFVTWTNNE